MGNLEGRPQFEAARMTGILSTDDIDVALVDEAAMLEALLYVSACEHCAENATIAFDYLLDAVTGCDPTETEYVMCRPATCPGCSAPITEKTRVVAD
jgi:hypothetical protein